MLRVADPDMKFGNSFKVSTPSIPTKLLLTHILPGGLKAKYHGFSQEIRKMSDYHNKAIFIKPCIFMIRKDKVIHSWRHNYADVLPPIISDVILLDLVDNESSTFETCNNRRISTPKDSNILVSSEEIIVESALSTSAIVPKVPIKRKIKRSANMEELTKEKLDLENQEATKMARKKIEHQSCFGNKHSDDSTSHHLELLDVLNNEKLRKYFIIYSHSKYNSENISFWEDVTLKYKPTALQGSSTQTKKMAVSLGEKYIFDLTSIMYINTNATLREEVQKGIEQLSNDFQPEAASKLFDNVISDLLTATFPDIFMQFKVSPNYQEMLNRHNRK